LNGHRCLVVEHFSRRLFLRSSPPALPRDNDNEALAYHNEEAKDDLDDFVACIFHDWKAAMV
jgi:hypothetical protein